MYHPPAPQRRPLKTPPPDQTRDSNALRASVLDAALAIGIGSSRVVENWMFNTVNEEDEEEGEESILSPGLTSGSTATSDESAPSPQAFGWYAPQPQSLNAYGELAKGQYVLNRSGPPSPSAVFPVPPPQPSPAPKTNKLRKKQRGGVDDGYVSDGGAAKKEKERKAKKKAAKAAASGAESSDDGGGYFSDFGRRKKTRTKKKDKGVPLPVSSAVDVGEESDGGYLSEASKKKRGFFRLKSKSSKASSLAAAPPVPTIPPPLPSAQSLPVLPIAGRFVRSPEPPSSASATSREPSFDTDLERSRSTTPLARAGLRNKASVDSVSTAEEPELETPTTSLSGHSHGHATSPAPTKKGVRFTPSTRFSGPLDQPAPRVPLIISAPGPLTPTRPRPAPSPTPSDFSLISASDVVEPSSTYILPSPSLSPSPLPSSAYIVPSPSATPAPPPLDFSAPRPSHLRVQVPSPSRARFSFADLPPPTPPPTGPLPDVPGADTTLAPPRFPPSAFAGSRSTSPIPVPGIRSGRASPLFAQPIPNIQRGRESPFPARPVLPQEESAQLVRRTSRTRRLPAVRIEDEQGQLASPGPQVPRDISRSPSPQRHDIAPGITYDGRGRARAPVLRESEDDVRSDVALFFFPPPTAAAGDTLSPYHSRIAPESVHEGSERDVFSFLGTDNVSTDGARLSAFDTDARVSAYNDDAPARLSAYTAADDASIYPPTTRSRSGIDSYYFENTTDSRPASFIDDERSGTIRARFVDRVRGMWGGAGGAQEDVPPVPALPARVGPAF
ncbi:hypothetical protein K488DRAFT_88476 [Vararia minispora EC-137]|uniref:Uncharacterized protein n=1 Tax=Vararia minispora EC-137 TaxID=1314806 RepID=A0ACB8QDB2_9AGAM|nr:hypothetical protein K488DRAFT_88476 [Vararia minispora EC-137]